MRIKKFTYYACDFETTVYDGQKYTEVWAAAAVELFTEKVLVWNNIHEFLDYFIEQPGNQCLYFHNLKFDGTFIISHFLRDRRFQQAFKKLDEDGTRYERIPDRHMLPRTFNYSIANTGQWYSILLRIRGKFIEFRDSLKLLPFSVKKLGKDFKTKHQKTEIEYTGFRYAGGVITKEERDYIANDVLVVKEALEVMFTEGHTELTIGSCCMKEFKTITKKKKFDELYPDLYKLNLNFRGEHTTVGDWIRQSYRGGWCYVKRGEENKLQPAGITVDVNSLYPSMMHSASGNRYPVGVPKFWEGDYIPEEATAPDRYFFVRIKTRFYLKEGHPPFIQQKNSFLYLGNENLETSDVYDAKTGKYYMWTKNADGTVNDTRMELTLTQTDYQRILDFYDLDDFEILGGCYFDAEAGIFDEYIEKYRQIKETSTGARRTLAKLYLNNLYGKMASSEDSSFKYVYLKDDGTLGFLPVYERDKTPGYIPVGSAITSYARDFTIRAAQANYEHFIYADTDSIHATCAEKDLRGIPLHPTAFQCWAIESHWKTGLFVRQKTYIEEVINEDGSTAYDMKCAGMPKRCKELFISSMTGDGLTPKTDAEIRFLKKKRKLTDFRVGLCVPSKLLPRRIPGGTVLIDSVYEMR